MAKIDSLIERLIREGQELVFETGSGATLKTRSGSQRPIKQPLTTSQIVAAMAELSSPDQGLGLGSEGVVEFTYASPSGPVSVRVERLGARAVAVLRPASGSTPASPSEGTARREMEVDRSEADSMELPAPADVPGRNASVQVAQANAEPRRHLDRLLERMRACQGSDLHLSSDCAPRVRVDGDIRPLGDEPVLSSERLKQLLWSIAPRRNQDEWEERKDTDFAHETEQARFRVNVFMDRKGMGAVIRQIPAEIRTAEALNLPKHVLDLCLLRKGLVLVTGPNGSGKSTTLAALVDFINRHRDDHIVTIEDPIEFVHTNKRCLVHQREVSVHTASFKAALRAVLREDSDVVLVGELMDVETMALAMETAETGHLVFGTLYTQTALSTVDRIIDLFPADRQAHIRLVLSESLKGVISQTLCRQIGGGRIAAQEILLVTPSVSNLIREGKTFQIPSVMQTGRAQGQQTLNDHLLEHVKKGRVEPNEAYAKAVARAELRKLFESAGIRLGELGDK